MKLIIRSIESRCAQLITEIRFIKNDTKDQIKDVRVYNRALTTDEIKRLYNLGRKTINESLKIKMENDKVKLKNRFKIQLYSWVLRYLFYSLFEIRQRNIKYTCLQYTNNERKKMILLF